MSALGLVGYGYDDDEEEEDDEEEDDNALADALNRAKDRPNGAAERPLSAAEMDRDRADQGERQESDAEQRNNQNGAMAISDEVQAPEHSLDEATPPVAPGGDVHTVEGSPREQKEPEFVLPSAPPWNVPGIPDAPDEKCDPKWQNRITWVLEQQKRTGKQMVTEMQRNKSYRNPRFMQKHIEEKTVNQYGTCFPAEVWDPQNLPKEDFLDRIHRQMKERDKAKRAKAAVNSVAQAAKATVQRIHPASMPASAARAGAALNSGTKRSKWDQTR